MATAELVQAGRSVILVDQESTEHLGGQAWWSFGGLFLVGSPEQRRMGIKDSFELAWRDWRGTAGFDRLEDEDSWAVRWAQAYVEWAAGEKRAWLHEQGVRVRTLSLFYEQWFAKLPIWELERTSLMFDIGELHGVAYQRVRRLADFVISIIGLVPLALLVPFVVLGNLVAMTPAAVCRLRMSSTVSSASERSVRVSRCSSSAPWPPTTVRPPGPARTTSASLRSAGC